MAGSARVHHDGKMYNSYGTNQVNSSGAAAVATETWGTEMLLNETPEALTVFTTGETS